jgi:hypothetical protein
MRVPIVFSSSSKKFWKINLLHGVLDQVIYKIFTYERNFAR